MRFIRRPVVGLALGGGGARGLAHIGVLKVFCQEQIPIDRISGTSMGGVLGAAFARGVTPAELEAEALRMSAPLNLARLLDFHPNRRGLIEGGRMRQYLADFVGMTTLFENLSLPLGLAAVDIESGEEVTLSEGPLLEAALATMSVPGVLPPVTIDGRELVDGGVLNNVPADIARKLGAEVVIAVDVGEQPTATISSEHSAWMRVAGDMLKAETIMSAALVRHKLEKARPEVILRPPLPDDLTIFRGFTRPAEAIAAGEAAARQAIPTIRRLLAPGLRLAAQDFPRTGKIAV